MTYPVQIQFDNVNAEEAEASMCQVFDAMSYYKLITQLPNIYLHVVAWDNNGAVVFKYDNR